jgi:hypothetical protein
MPINIDSPMCISEEFFMPFRSYNVLEEEIFNFIFDEIWKVLEEANSPAASKDNMSRSRIDITMNLRAALQAGERSHDRLRTLALKGTRCF